MIERDQKCIYGMVTWSGRTGKNCLKEPRQNLETRIRLRNGGGERFTRRYCTTAAVEVILSLTLLHLQVNEVACKAEVRLDRTMPSGRTMDLGELQSICKLSNDSMVKLLISNGHFLSTFIRKLRM